MADRSIPTDCDHPLSDRAEGSQRLPLVYGSAATEMCRRCGAWRYNLHGWSDWRPGSEWEKAMEVNDER